MKKRAREKPRYAAANGTLYSEKDAQIIGAALQKIAEANRVSDVRCLDKHLVYEAVEADEAHPLRPFYDWNNATAARKFRLEQTARMIRSVRTVTVSMGVRESFAPMFVAAEVADRKGVLHRSMVIRADSLASDPVFMSALGGKIRMTRDALNGLSAYAAAGSPPADVARLVQALRAAFDAYEAGLRENAA